LTFDVTTTGNATAAVSNSVIVSAAPPAVSPESAATGANTTYTIDDVPVTGLSSDANSLVVVARATSGSGTEVWYSGAAGYTVSYTVSAGGAATADAVSSVAVSTTVNAGDTVTLTLEAPLASGYAVNVTAEGTNPTSSGSDNRRQATTSLLAAR
jgi:hypothetical protein